MGALGLAAIGCAGEAKVVRVYEGRIVEGGFVPSTAYAAYLKGVLAEEAGDLRSALAAYEQAAQEDDEDPEPFTRIGDVRCKLDPANTGADEALGRALRIDKTYAPALAAKARCAAARGKASEGLAIVEQIAAADRQSASLEALFVRLASSAPEAPASRQARERAIALTLASGDDPVAWDALVAWGRGKADGELLARGLEGLIRAAPFRSRDVEAGALELLGIGHTGLARRVAARLADAPVELETHGIHDPTVARLAVDEAIVSGDRERAERRATRGHVPLAEVAARALILERPELAAATARSVLAADPNAGGAAMVLTALAARGPKGPEHVALAGDVPGRGKTAPTDRPAAACVLVLAERLAALGGIDAARPWAARVLSAGGAPLAPHDPVTGPLAVELAARGVIEERGLPLELRLELAARRREPPPAVDAVALETKVVDAKHALLWHLLVDPNGSPARTLLSRMSAAADRDPIIGFALARAALASAPGAPGKSDVWGPVLRAIAASPSHPLLLAVAVEIAQKGGRAEDVPPARARLMAVARTPAERALARE
ncbi:MAG: Tetratricopeptide 2 repeat protein [Labilithrix sp.]|nr:Tetratricopeptide 2 repeat protein [Labilithrix sp.]